MSGVNERKYPHLWKKCGVYQVTNVINGKFYIGSSQDISKRWIFHTCKLRKGMSYNPRLQEDWNRYGGNSFKISILEECLPEELFAKEQIWIDKLSAVENGYNYHPRADSCLGYKRTQEQNERNAKSIKEAFKSPEIRKKLSKSLILANQNPEYRKQKIDRLIRQNKEPEFIKRALETKRRKRELTSGKNPIS
jgi:group I intron endonuclease